MVESANISSLIGRVLKKRIEWQKSAKNIDNISKSVKILSKGEIWEDQEAIQT